MIYIDKYYITYKLRTSYTYWTQHTIIYNPVTLAEKDLNDEMAEDIDF
jgi:hypothetical protein